MDARPLGILLVGSILTGCSDLPDPPCLVGHSDFSPYLVQLRPQGPIPADCPQGPQYQVLVATQFSDFGTDHPQTAIFQFLGSGVLDGGAQAQGEFTTLLVPSADGACVIETLSSASDDSATPVGSSAEVVATTYTFSGMRVLSDAEHRGNQFEARTIVDYELAGCTQLEYVAQAVFPIRRCLNDSVCLPEAVVTDVDPPAGRARGSLLTPDYRAFCNLDPALLDNVEVVQVLRGFYGQRIGRDVYKNPNDGTLHDVGVCFLSEPFPSLCPAGSTLSTSGPCVVGPGSNPH